jgi:hypothetical protein
MERVRANEVLRVVDDLERVAIEAREAQRTIRGSAIAPRARMY